VQPRLLRGKPVRVETTQGRLCRGLAHDRVAVADQVAVDLPYARDQAAFSHRSARASSAITAAATGWGHRLGGGPKQLLMALLA
jgi:hypothetical protein